MDFISSLLLSTRGKWFFFLVDRCSVDIIFVVEDILEVNDQTFSMTVEVKILMSWRDRRLS